MHNILHVSRRCTIAMVEVLVQPEDIPPSKLLVTQLSTSLAFERNKKKGVFEPDAHTKLPPPEHARHDSRAMCFLSLKTIFSIDFVPTHTCSSRATEQICIAGRFFSPHSKSVVDLTLLRNDGLLVGN